MKLHRWVVSMTVVLSLLPAAPAAAGRTPRLPRTILAEWRRDVWQDPELRTMDETGGNMGPVVTAIQRSGPARWSPDGRRIGGFVKQDATGQGALMSAAADGGGERVVLSAQAFDAYNVAAGHPSALGPAGSSPFGTAAWGPGGGAMVFSGMVVFPGADASTADDDRWRPRLFTVTVPGGQIQRVTYAEGEYYDTDPHWSHTLNKIVFVRRFLVPFGAERPELWTVNPDGSQARLLTDFAASRPSSGYGTNIAAPVWSPDGTRIVVVGNLDAENRCETGDLWLLDVARGTDGLMAVTGQRVLRGAVGVSERQPAWSPNGASIAYARITPITQRQFRYQLVLADVATARDTVIVDSTKQAVLYPDWRQVPVP